MGEVNSFIWGAVGLAGAVALVAPVTLRPLLSRLKVFDVPSQRSSHSHPTLRGGGVAPLLGFVLGGILVSVAMPAELAPVLAASVLMGLVGLVEDLKGLRVVVRASLQISIGGALAIILSGVFGIHWIWIPIAALGFAANVNITNFMDGVNGISSLHGFVAGLAFAALGALQGAPWLVTVGLITAVTFIAFLPWNLTPPGMFLGDVGSYLLGGALGAASIVALVAGLNPIAALAPLSIYWIDALTTLFLRAARGQPVLEPHREHAYQRLTNSGLSHVAVALTVAAFTAASAIVGLMTAESIISLDAGISMILVIGAAYLLLPWLRGVASLKPDRDVFPAVTLPAPALVQNDWRPTKWAVIGASGFIGGATAEHLSQQGIDVRVISAPRIELSPGIVDGEMVADLAESHPASAALAQQLLEVDVVINAAGLAMPDSPADTRLFGANGLLPAVIAVAAARVNVGRLVHLSSAAVQGDRSVLDASSQVSPFSPYSRSKALGERGLLAVVERRYLSCPDLVIIRATSVQGPERVTTQTLRRVARSPLASVAAPGSQPTIVSSVAGLVKFIYATATTTGPQPVIALQPWEGMNVLEVLEAAGGHPLVLPEGFCRMSIKIGKSMTTIFPRISGMVRRVDLMWFGQRQELPDFRDELLPNQESVRNALAGRPDGG